MAAWRVVETLSRTGGFGVQVTRRRLLETSQHFLEVVEDLDSVKPGGKGFVSSVRVRLLHSTVRRRIMELERQKQGYYDTRTWGVPINDLHQVGTIGAYSAALVWMSLPRQGVYLSEEETADYLALWRWVGYIMGTPVDWMATPASAKAMMESVITSEMNPSRNSQIIANNILTAEVGAPPLNAPRPLLAALAYRLNGHEMASALGIDRPNAWYRGRAWVLGLILTFMSSSYPFLPEWWQRSRDRVRFLTPFLIHPRFDTQAQYPYKYHTHIYTHKAYKAKGTATHVHVPLTHTSQNFIKFGHDMVTNHKMGGLGHSARFEFQYTPALGKTTEMGAFDSSGSWQRAVVATVGIVLGVAVAALVSSLFYPWHEIAVQRMGGMMVPAEQVLDKLF